MMINTYLKKFYPPLFLGKHVDDQLLLGITLAIGLSGMYLGDIIFGTYFIGIVASDVYSLGSIFIYK